MESSFQASNKQPCSKLFRYARLSLRESGVLHCQSKRLGVWTKSRRSKLRGINPSEIKTLKEVSYLQLIAERSPLIHILITNIINDKITVNLKSHA